MTQMQNAEKRMYAFITQHTLRSLSWDGQMLVGMTRDGIMLSALDLDHSSAIRPMWLHLEHWLASEASDDHIEVCKP